MRNTRSGTVRALKAVTLLLLISAVSGCALYSEIAFYGDLYRAHRAGVRFRRTYDYLEADVPFSRRSDVTLDVYGQPEGGGYPVLVFVHGGGWNSYNKELFTPVAMQLLPQEMVVVIPDYTLHPDATYDQMAREVADAAAWVLENVADYGGDPARVFLSGHSAGAHLSALVSYDPRWLAETGHSVAESEGMTAALRAAGVEAELIVYPGAAHSDILFGALNDDDAQVIRDIGRIVRL